MSYHNSPIKADYLVKVFNTINTGNDSGHGQIR